LDTNEESNMAMAVSKARKAACDALLEALGTGGVADCKASEMLDEGNPRGASKAEIAALNEVGYLLCILRCRVREIRNGG
jgi:hypothetical protein